MQQRAKGRQWEISQGLTAFMIHPITQRSCLPPCHRVGTDVLKPLNQRWLRLRFQEFAHRVWCTKVGGIHTYSPPKLRHPFKLQRLCRADLGRRKATVRLTTHVICMCGVRRSDNHETVALGADGQVNM